MNTGKLMIGVTVGILLAAAVIFGIYQMTQPRDCALQRLQHTSVDGACA